MNSSLRATCWFGLVMLSFLSCAQEDNFTTDFDEFAHSNKRVEKNAASPAFLDAVGQLIIETTRGNKSSCTGFLVSTEPGAASDLLGSAAHCIDKYAHSKDLQRKSEKIEISNIVWQTTVKGRTLTREARVVAYDFDTDQMLLRLDQVIPFSQIKPLLIEAEGLFSPDDLILYATKLISAGFNADSYKGKYGKVLTYDDKIDINQAILQDTTTGTDIIPLTVTFSGASGGPLIAEMDLTDEDITNPFKQMYVIGTLYGFSGVRQSTNYVDDGNKMGTNRPRFRDYRRLWLLYSMATDGK